MKRNSLASESDIPDKYKIGNAMERIPVFKIQRQDNQDTTCEDSELPFDSLRTSSKSKVNFSKLTKEELEERCKRQAYDIKQLKRKIRFHANREATAQPTVLTSEQFKIISAHEVLQQFESLKPEQRMLLVEISSVILRKEMILRTSFVASLHAMVKRHLASISSPESVCTGTLTAGHMGQLDSIIKEMLSTKSDG